MFIAFIFGLISYIWLIWFQIRLYQHNALSEARFVLFQIAFLGLIILSGCVAFLPTNEEQLIGIFISILCMVAGIPAARWLYRKVIFHKY